MEILFRFFGIYALVFAGIVFRWFFRTGEAKRFSAVCTDVLFPLYVFWSLMDIDPVDFSLSRGISIAVGFFIIAWAVFFSFRLVWVRSPYPFVCASKNLRSIGIPLVHLRFYDSALAEVAIFSVFGMALFEASAAWFAPSVKDDASAVPKSFAVSFFAAFALGSALHGYDVAFGIQNDVRNLSVLFGKNVAGLLYSVASLFLVGYSLFAVGFPSEWLPKSSKVQSAESAPLQVWASQFKTFLKTFFPVALAQVAVWPLFAGLWMFADASVFGGAAAGGAGYERVRGAVFLLSFMPSSVTAVAFAVRSGQGKEVSAAVAASILWFFAYWPLLWWWFDGGLYLVMSPTP